jgi:acyl-CoA thioester hydrolase
VVDHSNYLIWFEVGRVELIRQMGLSYKAMEEEGCSIAVVEANVRYRAPARYDDELVVRTRVAQMRGSVIKMAYTIHRADDDLLLCEGGTTHVVVDRSMKKAAMPARYAEAFRASMEG